MPEKQPTYRSYLYGAILVLIGSIFFSTKAVIVKLAYQYEVDSVSLLALRMLFSLPVFLVVGWWNYRQRPAVKPILKVHWWKVVILGICGYYLASLLDFWGLQYITASLERVGLFIYPTIVLLLSALFLKKRIQLRQVLALSITYLGIGIAFWTSLQDDQQVDIVRGGILVFSAAAVFAVYVVGSGELLRPIGTKIYNSLAMTSAAFAILTHHYFVNGLELTGFHPHVYQYAMLLALVGTVIPSFMVAEGIRLIGANNSGLISSIGPISTIVLAYLFLGETLSILQWLGTLLVIGGVLLIVFWKNSEKTIEAK